MKKLWNKIVAWFRKHFGKRDKTPRPLKTFTVEIEE